MIALAKRVQRVVGYVPAGFSDLLNILSHPDVAPLTQAWWDHKSSFVDSEVANNA
jgi:hypothetical protein